MQTITRNVMFVQNYSPDLTNKVHSLSVGLNYFYNFLAQSCHNKTYKLIEVHI